MRIFQSAHVTTNIFHLGDSRTCSGGMGREAIVFYRRLADHLSRRGSTSYSQTLAFIRCTLSFSLLRSATMCIRGSRQSISHRSSDASEPLLRWAALMSTGTFKLLAICSWSFLFSCPARAFFVLGVVGKGSPSSPGKKKSITGRSFSRTPAVAKRINRSV